MSYAQFGEDELALEFFGAQKGRFLDLGAFDGTTRSNTLLLAERGWSGISVDASWEVVPKALETYKNLNVKFVSAAVGITPGLVPFFDCTYANLSTCSEGLLKKTPDMRTLSGTRLVACVTVRQIAEAFPGSFEYISVDLEGMTWPVLQTIPLKDLGCRMACVEYLHPVYTGMDEESKIKEYMASSGFSFKAANPSNLVFVR